MSIIKVNHQNSIPLNHKGIVVLNSPSQLFQQQVLRRIYLPFIIIITIYQVPLRAVHFTMDSPLQIIRNMFTLINFITKIFILSNQTLIMKLWWVNHLTWTIEINHSSANQPIINFWSQKIDTLIRNNTVPSEIRAQIVHSDVHKVLVIKLLDHLISL